MYFVIRTEQPDGNKSGLTGGDCISVLLLLVVAIEWFSVPVLLAAEDGGAFVCRARSPGHNDSLL